MWNAKSCVCVSYLHIYIYQQSNKHEPYLIWASLLLSWRWWWWSYYIIYILACVCVCLWKVFFPTQVREYGCLFQKKVFNFLLLMKFYKYWFRMFTKDEWSFWLLQENKTKNIFRLSSSSSSQRKYFQDKLSYDRAEVKEKVYHHRHNGSND